MILSNVNEIKNPEFSARGDLPVSYIIVIMIPIYLFAESYYFLQKQKSK